MQFQSKRTKGYDHNVLGCLYTLFCYIWFIPEDKEIDRQIWLQANSPFCLDSCRHIYLLGYLAIWLSTSHANLSGVIINFISSFKAANLWRYLCRILRILWVPKPWKRVVMSGPIFIHQVNTNVNGVKTNK